ncbi:DUF1080 domain-containing protein [Bremerella cremea]|uniref:3-keto-disaccharide hydrolase n=1 Tax=Bremerella cremea TaxID=1031537 RepID=UPI0031ECF2C2
MKLHLPSALALLLLLSCVVTLPAAEKETDEKKSEGEWIQLFNGKDLTGWVPKVRYHELGENPADTFRVEDGLLTVSYADGYEDGFKETFGHLFYEKPFSNYRLRVEYRFLGDQCKGGPGWAFRNSGVMIHGEDPKTMGKDQDFPASIEVQLLGGREQGSRPTVNLCTPGTNVVMDGKLFKPHCINSSSETYRGDQWVTCEIEAHGNGTIKHIIDGKVVLEYEKSQLDPSDAHSKELIEKAGGELMLSGGSISLQSESHPVQFRKVEIMLLDE